MPSPTTPIIPLLTTEQLKRICPAAPIERLEKFLPFLLIYMEQYEINTPLRISAFIAQIAHESGSFRYTREIASGSAYEGREDLGNIHPGDGVKFKGGGLIQTTGRTNYAATSVALFGDRDILLDKPELLSTPKYAVMSACWYWKSRGLNKLADEEKFDKITKKINGGYRGKAERDLFYSRAREVLLGIRE